MEGLAIVVLFCKGATSPGIGQVRTSGVRGLGWTKWTIGSPSLKVEYAFGILKGPGEWAHARGLNLIVSPAKIAIGGRAGNAFFV